MAREHRVVIEIVRSPGTHVDEIEQRAQVSLDQRKRQYEGVCQLGTELEPRAFL